MDKYQESIAKWNEQKLNTEAEYTTAMCDFEMMFSYHSGKLDNNAITFSDTREIFCHGTVSDYTGAVSTLREICNYKLCCDLVRARLCEGRAFSLELANDIFLTLSQGMEDSGISAPLPDEKERLGDIIDEVNAYSGDRILKAGTYLHAASIYLAPFGIYSSRIARFLLNYYLMAHKHPPVIIYSFDKIIYEDCLERFSEQEELSPLFKFLQYEVEKLWIKTQIDSESVVQ